MSLETALLFESVEEIYIRVFRALRPRTSLPAVEVRWRRYANANSRIRLEQGKLSVDISDLLREAPAPVQEDLAFILLSKLLGRRPEPAALSRYRRFLQRADMRRSLHSAKRERGRKTLRPPEGIVFNLVSLFEKLNFRYFHGLIAQPTIGWSLKPSRTVLGHYDPSHHTIVLTCLLDSADVPPLVVEYVMFHEMLHLRFPARHSGGRRCVHTPEFKRAEREFESFEEAKCLLQTFMEKVHGEKAELN